MARAVIFPAPQRHREKYKSHCDSSSRRGRPPRGSSPCSGGRTPSIHGDALHFLESTRSLRVRLPRNRPYRAHERLTGLDIHLKTALFVETPQAYRERERNISIIHATLENVLLTVKSRMHSMSWTHATPGVIRTRHLSQPRARTKRTRTSTRSPELGRVVQRQRRAWAGAQTV